MGSLQDGFLVMKRRSYSSQFDEQSRCAVAPNERGLNEAYETALSNTPGAYVHASEPIESCVSIK